ncbi:hypothetical protein [Algirhabdus cladophorae]|uniref:hypothetical protein n=1 Tax=Algirhabdus cladophorae TaxID=3377108 RepID=UPI003B849913
MQSTPTHKPKRRRSRWVANQVPRKILRDVANRLKYGAEAPQSDECLYLDPGQINLRFVAKPPYKTSDFRRKNSGQVRDGDWDQQAQPMVDDIKYMSCKARFIDHANWEDTPIFHKLSAEIAAGGSPDDCYTIEDLRQRYKRLDALWALVLRTQELKPKAQLPDQYRREHGGVFVHLDRHGNALRYGGGMHRFAIARLAKLPAMPVQVGVVHADFVASGRYPALRQKPS